MAKKRSDRSTEPQNASARTQIPKGDILRLICTVIVTLVVFVTYRLLMNAPYFHIAFIAYLVVATAAVLGYVIYNRGFSRKGLTPDMLPQDWSEEKKLEYIGDGERRLKSSRPLLILVIAFGVTFAIDIIELFTIPFITELFTK